LTNYHPFDAGKKAGAPAEKQQRQNHISCVVLQMACGILPDFARALSNHS
jgi:hypothetical protein